MRLIVDLFMFWIAVYGLAWTLTKSSLLKNARTKVRVFCIQHGWGVMAEGVQCIVCASAWCAMLFSAVAWMMPLFSDAFRDGALYSCPLLVFGSVAATWLVARKTGDAD